MFSINFQTANLDYLGITISGLNCFGTSDEILAEAG